MSSLIGLQAGVRWRYPFHMNKYALIALLASMPAVHAEEPATEKKAAPQKEEQGKLHADPRFKGKVMVYGTSSESFGEAPRGDDLKTRKLESVDEEAPAPKPLPVPK